MFSNNKINILKKLHLFSCFFLLLSCSSNIEDKLINFDNKLIIKYQADIIRDLYEKYHNSIHRSIDIKVNLKGEVTSLSMHGLMFSDIPKNIYKLNTLDTLIISQSPLTVFPNVSSFKKLKWFQISSPNLKGKIILNNKIPKALKILRLSGCGIDNVEFTEEIDIEELLIFNTLLKKIDSSFLNLKKVHTLSLDGSRIKSVDIDLTLLKNLKTFSLRRSMIEDTINIKKRYPHITFSF